MGAWMKVVFIFCLLAGSALFLPTKVAHAQNSSLSQVEFEIQEVLKALLGLEKESFAATHQFKPLPALKYSLPGLIEKTVKLSISINQTSLLIQMNGVAEPVLGKKYTINEAGVITGIANAGHGADDKKLESEIQDFLKVADAAMKKYQVAHGSYSADLKAIEVTVPEHLAKMGNLKIDISGTGYHLEFVGKTAPIQNHSFTLQSLANAVAGKAGAKPGDVANGKAPAKPEGATTDSRLENPAFRKRLDAVLLLLLKHPPAVGKSRVPVANLDVSFRKAEATDSFPPASSKVLFPFGPDYQFRIQENDKDSAHTLYIYDKNMKPAMLIFNLQQFQRFLATEKYFYWQSLSKSQTGMCRVSLENLQAGCFHMLGEVMDTDVFTPSENRFVRQEKDVIKVFDFASDKWITGPFGVEKVSWKSEDAIVADGRLYSLTDLSTAYQVAAMKQDSCVNWLKSLQAQFAEGPYVFERKFELLPVQNGVENRMIPLLVNVNSHEGVLQLKTREPIKAQELLRKQEPSCVYLKDVSLSFVQGESDFYTSELNKMPNPSACGRFDDCAAHIIKFGPKEFTVNRTTELKMIGLMSQLESGQAFIRDSIDTQSSSLICEKKVCVQAPQYQYPQGLLAGHPNAPWRSMIANFSSEGAHRVVGKKYLNNIINISFQPGATVQQVNDVLKNEGLKIQGSSRGRLGVDVISARAQTDADREALISKLQKNKWVSAVLPVEVSVHERACIASGGSIQQNQCQWDDPKVDFSKVLTDTEKECARVGGQYTDLPSTCVDQCSYEATRVCGEAITKGCDCGPDRCWNRGTCIQNPKSLDQATIRQIREEGSSGH
jgi:hypothetical protein